MARPLARWARIALGLTRLVNRALTLAAPDVLGRRLALAVVTNRPHRVRP